MPNLPIATSTIARQKRFLDWLRFGFIRATQLRRNLRAGTEFQVFTLWDSLGSIEAFAGVDIEVAVVPRAVQASMVDYDRSVAHYEIAHTFDPR